MGSKSYLAYMIYSNYIIGYSIFYFVSSSIIYLDVGNAGPIEGSIYYSSPLASSKF
jgi:hypothetical protein